MHKQWRSFYKRLSFTAFGDPVIKHALITANWTIQIQFNWSAHWQVLQKPSHDPDNLNQVPWRRETSKPCRPVALEERIWTFGLRCTVCTMWLPVNPGRFAPKSSGIGSSSAVTQSRQVQQIMDAWIHITRGTKKKIFRYLSQDGFIAFMSRYK